MTLRAGTDADHIPCVLCFNQLSQSAVYKQDDKSVTLSVCCMARTYSAGVFAGYIESRNGKEAVLRKARRIWYWDGAASLSQLATEGTSKPQNCKFPCEVDKVILTEVIEIIPITEKAKKSIAEVEVWKC